MLRGDRIRQRREKIGMKQADLARALGIKQTILSRMERGANVNPHADLLKRLALALHCSIDWLVDLYDDDIPTEPLAAAVGP